MKNTRHKTFSKASLFNIFMLLSVSASAANDADFKELPRIFQPTQTVQEILFPETMLLSEGYLRVSDLHEIWYAEYGNKDGTPVAIVHGGPGSGCLPLIERFFDPSFYRIIKFDQRGAMRSKPTCELKDNTTQDLVEDMEKLRKHLKIDKWALYGGSWGTTLAIVYGETYPSNCLGFILRGVFLGSTEEAEELCYGMGKHYPEAFERYKNFLPLEERSTLLDSYNKRILSEDPAIALPAVMSTMLYNGSCVSALEKLPDLFPGELPPELAVCMMKTYTHYSTHNFFLEPNQIMDNLSKITDKPAIFVQSRHDVHCLPKIAYQVHLNWPGSKFYIVTDAAHLELERGVVKGMVTATEEMKKVLS